MSSFSFIVCQLLIMASVFEMSTAMYSSKQIEGYPQGLIPDCPNKTMPLSKEDLKKLSFVVRGALPGKKIKYNYYQMGLMAKNPYMDWSKKIVLYVGGYMSSPSHVDGRVMEQLYAELGYNVWLFDEFAFIVGVYPAIARRMQFTGMHGGDMLAELTNIGVLDPANIEMVGPSLGGHTMGFIAKRYYQLTGKKISRITAFDPAGPCFRNLGPEGRLDDTDAELVISIMTNIEGYGMAAPVGHINFYVNGGEFQLLSASYLPCTVFCSHVRSFLIWAAAVQFQDHFIGVKCHSIQQARDRRCYENVPQVTNVLSPTRIDPTKPGIYYLATTNKYPFYMGEKGLSWKNDLAYSLPNYIFRGLQ